VASQPSTIVVATLGGVLGINESSRPQWTASLTGLPANALPTSVTVAPHVAYVTFEPSSTSPGYDDVFAIALDDRAHA
ncbi:MAG TPA: hypothetical protein VH442_01610, partial [Micromonosporaceae bacterium]